VWTVESIRTIEVRDEARDAGAVAGGLSGAAAGNRTDGGSANTAMTILGTVAGAITGDETERNVKKRYAYRVTVRMDDGSFRTVSVEPAHTRRGRQGQGSGRQTRAHMKSRV